MQTDRSAAIPSNAIIQEIMQLQIPVIINFCGSRYCAHHSRLQIIHDLVEKYAGNLKIVHTSTEEGTQLATFFGMSSLPDFLFFQDGRVSGISKGTFSEEEIEMRLNMFRKFNRKFLFLIVDILPWNPWNQLGL